MVEEPQTLFKPICALGHFGKEYHFGKELMEQTVYECKKCTGCTYVGFHPYRTIRFIGYGFQLYRLPVRVNWRIQHPSLHSVN